MGVNGDQSENLKEMCLRAMDERIFFGWIGRNNFLFFSEEKISNQIREKFPELKSVDFQKKIKTRALLVSISGRDASAVWCPAWFDPSSSSTLTAQPENEKCFFIDEQGFVFQEAPILSGSMFATIFDVSFAGKGLGSTGLEKSKLDFILEAKKEIISKNLDLGDFLIRPESTAEIELLSPDGWRVYLDLASSAATQIDSLARALTEEIKEKKNQLEYVDLRVPGRIYYKLK